MRSRTSGVPGVVCAPQAKSTKVSLSNASIMEGGVRLDHSPGPVVNQGFKALVASSVD